MAAKNPLSTKTRELTFQGINPADDTVSFVEHHDFAAEGEDPRPTGITLVVFDRAAWARAGGPTTAKVTIDLSD